MSVKILSVLYVPWMLALTIGYYAVPSISNIIWLMIGLSAATAIGVGIKRFQPRRKLPWVLQAISLVALVSGDTIYNVLAKVLGQVDPFPSIADAIYLTISSPLQALGLYLLARAARDRIGMLDGLGHNGMA